MPPKKNGFIRYATALMQRLKAEGVACSLPGAIELAGPEWAIMTPEQRKLYQGDCKPATTTDKDTTGARPNKGKKPPEAWRSQQTTMGYSLGEVIDGHVREHHYEEQMVYETKRLLDLTHGDPITMEFVVMNFSIYCVCDDGTTRIPAEVGLSAFSLAKGVTDNYTTLIDPGAVPMGYACDFREEGGKLGVPVPPFDPECQNYGRILENIDKFMLQHRTKTGPKAETYLFCLRSELTTTRACMDWLTQKCGVKREYKIYSLSLLLQNLAKFGKAHYFSHLGLRRKVLSDMVEQRGLWGSGGTETDSDTDDTETSGVSGASWTSMSEELETINQSAKSCVPPFPIDDGRLRARNILHTTAHTMAQEANKEFAKTSGSGEATTTDESSVDMDDPNFISTSATLGPKTKWPEPPHPYQDDELFMFERMAEEFLQSGDLAFSPEIACPHHMVNPIGVNTCPMSVVNRYAFNIIDILIGYFPAHHPIEGAHYPLIEPAAEKMRLRTTLETWGRPGYRNLEGFNDSVVYFEKAVDGAEAEWERAQSSVIVSGTGRGIPSQAVVSESEPSPPAQTESGSVPMPGDLNYDF